MNAPVITPVESLTPPGPPPRQDAFTRLGTPVPEGVSIREGLEAAGMLGWNVHTVPLYADINGGKRAFPENQRGDGLNAVIRTRPDSGRREILGVVGRKWTPFQNEDAASLLSEVADISGARLTNAMTLNGGRKVALVMTLPEGMVFTSPITGAHDVTNLNLVVFNSHDGYGSLTALLTPVRLWCMNQQRMAESLARSRFSLRHTGNAKLRIAELRELIADSLSYRGVYQDQVERLIGHEIDDGQALVELQRLFHALSPQLTERQREIRSATVERVLDLYRASPTVAPFAGTAYGLYNAITEYTDHVMRVIVPEGGDAMRMRALRTLQSEPMDSLKQRAFTQLLPAPVA